LPKIDFTKIRNAINWRVVAAALATISVIATGVGIFSYQQYTQNQQEIAANNASLSETALRIGQEKIAEITPLVDELEAIVREAMEVEILSKGRTLDEDSREQLAIEIENGKQIWVDQKNLLLELEAAVKALKALKDTAGQWALNASAYAKLVTERAAVDWSPTIRQIDIVLETISTVQLAQAAWQVEQDRIAAAEAAARMAKAKTVSPVSTIADDGASAVTAPAPPPPPPPVAADEPPPPVPTTMEVFLLSYQQALDQGITTRAFIESYVLSLAPGSIFTWTAGLCNGFYVCGRARVGGLNTNPVEIILDPNIEAVYVDRNGIGRYVLVHEAAHARQWFRFGSPGEEGLLAFIASQEQFTASNGITGELAVEYMADCMTIGLLGYTVQGSYTTSCTPEQFSAAASMW
jgi:cell division protein FtsB